MTEGGKTNEKIINQRFKKLYWWSTLLKYPTEYQSTRLCHEKNIIENGARQRTPSQGL